MVVSKQPYPRQDRMYNSPALLRFPALSVHDRTHSTPENYVEPGTEGYKGSVDRGSKGMVRVSIV